MRAAGQAANCRREEPYAIRSGANGGVVMQLCGNMNIYTVRGRGKGREAQAMSKAKRRVGRELTVNYRGFPMGVN